MATTARRRSPLSKRTNQRRNTKGRRQRMSRASFAVPKGTGKKPGQAQYRIDDAAHARNALARVSQFGSAAEKRMVRRKVAAKYPSIGATTSAKKKTAKRGKR